MMHDENTHLRSIRACGKNVTDRELELLDRRKYATIRRLNRLTHQVRKIEEGIRRNEEERVTNERELSEAAKDGAVSGSKSVALRIHRLEKFLDQTLGHQRFVARINDGYRELLKELVEDSIGRDARTRALEQHLDIRHQEYARLVTLYHNATSQYENVQRDLKSFDSSFQQARHLKDKALADRRLRVETALRQTQGLEQRQVELQQEIDEELQRIEEAEIEKQLVLQRRRRTILPPDRNSVVAGTSDYNQRAELSDRIANALLASGSAKDEERMRAFEKSFVKMMRVTEAESLDDLVNKFSQEQALREQLQKQYRDEQKRLEDLQNEVARLKKKVKDHEVTYVHPAPVTFCMKSELDSYVTDASCKRDSALGELTTLERILAEVVQHTDVLAEQVSLYKPEVVVPRTKIENVVTNLQLLGAKILSLADETVDRTSTAPCVASIHVNLPSSNTRVKLCSIKEQAKTATPTTSTPVTNNPPSPETDGSCFFDKGSCFTDSVTNGIVPIGGGKLGISTVSSDSGEHEDDTEEGRRSMALLDNDEPLGREQIKRLAAVVLRREERRRLREERQR
ncbi:hypothetical protein DPX39_080045800 [Trypanosoma brucei equiperdum]|nr:hypothetical protein DPX39_080045800 [Trypanosoma brucei equiperdum]